MITYKKTLAALTIAGALASSGVAFAQTASTTTGTGTTNTTTTTDTNTTTATPAAPNTGSGGDAATTMAMLGGSALVVAAGAAYLARKRVTA